MKKITADRRRHPEVIQAADLVRGRGRDGVASAHFAPKGANRLVRLTVSHATADRSLGTRTYVEHHPGAHAYQERDAR